MTLPNNFADLSIVGPLAFALYARTSTARAVKPLLVTIFYKALPWYGGFIGLMAIAFDQPGDKFFFGATAVACFCFWLIDYYDAYQPDIVPIGLRLWANFQQSAVRRDQAGLVDTDHLVEEMKRNRPKRGDAARTRAETHKAKVDAFNLAAEKEYLDAQSELARKARELDEAKIRMAEAKRRSSRVGRK